MKSRWIHGVIALFLALPLAISASAKEPRKLMWDQMVPEDEWQAEPLIPDPAAPPPMQEEENLGGWTYGTNPVEELDGQYVKLPGFIVPLESDEGGLLDEFLLVPYFGACIHVPPPPPNQIVYVRLKEPYDVTEIWEPYWIIGTMRTQTYSGDIATAVYQLEGEDVERYEY